MSDYLQPVEKGWRIASIIGCTLAAIICLLLSVLLWADMIRRHSFEYDGKPLWLGAVVIGVIGAAAAFIAWRLRRRHPAANGATVLPAWFIQLFGVLFLVGQGFAAYHRGGTVFMAEGIVVALAMIFIGWRIEKGQRR
jgi:integral membrane sensor domain MASE1